MHRCMGYRSEWGLQNSGFHLSLVFHLSFPFLSFCFDLIHWFQVWFRGSGIGGQGSGVDGVCLIPCVASLGRFYPPLLSYFPY